MNQIVLNVQNDSIAIATSSTISGLLNSGWFLVALFEFFIIILLLIFFNRKKPQLSFSDLSKEKLKAARSGSFDMDGLMESINNSKDLYKELSRVCHPDRFVNTKKHSIAEEIFQEISKNKRNYLKLSELKDRIKIELNINFKN